MSRVYATAAEFTTSVWCPEFGAPSGKDLERLLSTASMLVERLTVNAVYDTDDDGMPTKTRIKNAFRDATCAQAGYAHETGDVSGAGIGTGSMSIGSLSLGGRRVSSNTPDDIQAALVSTEMVNILRNEGLITAVVNESW